MGVLGGSGRRLGRRSRFYELVLKPLTPRERVRLVAGLGVLALLIILPTVGASNSTVGSFVLSPFASCEAESGWVNPLAASGQPDVKTDGGGASWQDGDAWLRCRQLNIEDEVVLKPTLSISTVLGQVDTKPILLGGDTATRTIPEPSRVISSLGEPKPSFDAGTLLRIEYSTDQKNWQPLQDLNQQELGGPAVFIALPPLTRTELLNLSVRIAVVGQPESPLTIDSVGLAYQIGQPTQLDVTLVGQSSAMVLPPERPASAEVTINEPASDWFDGLKAQLVDQSEPELTMSASLVGADNEVQPLKLERTWHGVDLTGDLRWQLSYFPPDELEPGSYRLVTRLTGPGGETIEDVKQILWGVVALNTAKSSYRPGETVEFLMSVLNERGATVCDATINLKLSLAGKLINTLETGNGSIATTDTCSLYGEHTDPDYLGSAQLDRPGRYEIELQVTAGEKRYELTDSVDVTDNASFIASRNGPTRLFPVKAYNMEISLSFAQDFNGELVETLPASFKSLSLPGERPYTLSDGADSQLLSWTVTARAGDELIFRYRFDAPDISPAFYTLGPLQLVDSDGKTSFREPRRWQLAGDAVGRMLMFWDGGGAPTGWTCVSCNPGDPFYQIFPRGSDTYGGTGGSANHTHTASASVAATGAAAVSDSQSGTTLSNNAHTHTASVTIGNASNLPQYRQLNIIRANSTGEPATIPTGAIGLFDATVPSGWTRYSAQDSYYPRGEGTAGTTGGSNSHSHSVSGNVNAAGGSTNGIRSGGSQVATANASHTHTYSGTSSSVSNEPSYVEFIFGKLDAETTPPDGLLTMWDDEVPANWTRTSGTTGAHYRTFFKGAASYGGTGGNGSHTHVNTVITSSTPSASTNSRTGSAGASSTHTHQVTAASYSTDNHLPPYRDVVIGKRVPQSDVELSGYRLFANADGTDVGAALATQDAPANTPRQGVPFRLRLLLHITNADLSSGDKVFKLQIAQRSGTCDTSFTGETYADVDDDSGDVRYHNNSSPTDGDNLTTNANDPTHSTHTIEEQTYEEANNFTNSTSAIQIGEDGLWDFSLIDFSATASTNYCLRVVRSNGDQLQTYSVLPEIITDDGNGHMLLLWDGGSIPSGWTCVSCNPGDEIYQRFFRGEASYGGTGGSANHSHTANGSVATTTNLTLQDQAGSTISSGGHSHTLSPTLSSASNLPSYRQLKVIRANISGVPTSLPAGIIAMFDATVPTGWTRYSAQDGAYIYGNGTAGTTGGSNSHNHSVSGTTSAGSGSAAAATNGTQVSAANPTHTHTVSGSTASDNQEPPYRDTILGKLDSDNSVSVNTIALWDGPPPGSWTNLSTSGQPFYQRFVKAGSTYGGTGGSTTHSHSNAVITSSTPSATLNRRSGSVNASGTHTHQVTISSISTENNLPPYINVVFAKMTTPNTAPDDPTNIDQIRTSDSSSLAVGEWTNDGQIRFEGDATDPDNPDDLQLCVEVELIGTAFDNTDTSCGSAVSFGGSTVTVTVTVTGLTHDGDYHWQARIKDGGGAVSGWLSFGANAESATDFSNDSVDPAGSVFDGTTTGVDSDLNSGSLSSLSANWDISDATSGIDSFDYSIGTSQGATDVTNWTNHGTSTSVTVNSLNLRTTQPYYFNIRATDLAGNQTTTSSDGLLVAPTLSFSISPSSITFDNLNSGNAYTSSRSATLTTGTNAYAGYVIRAHVTQLPTSSGASTVPLFNGGTYASPDEWRAGDIGYGYTSNDSTIQGVNLFGGTPCAGGGNPPCYAPFATLAPGDIVADHTTNVTGTPVADENFIVTQRVTTNSSQPAGTYTTTVIYTVIARY